LSSLPAYAYGLGHEFLPPDHWAYRALERFETLGLIELPSERPYTRGDVARYVEAANGKVAEGERTVSRRDRFEIDRLEREFIDATSREDPKHRYDPPIVSMRDGPLHAEGDLWLGFAPRKELRENQWDFFGLAAPEVRLHAKDWLTYEVRYQLAYGPERGNRVRDAKPSPREKSFKGLTSIYERSYVVSQWKKVTLFWGRDYADWGPSEGGNLLVSETAQSLDKFGAQLRFKNLRLSFLNATLSSESDRHLSAHRLEMAFGRLLVGIAETVVYVDRGIDPLYVLPLSSFYANQFNERSDDNVLWALDAKYRLMDGVVLYGAFLIDDFQFERDGNNPDKIGFDLGLRVALAAPVPAALRLQYRYVDIFTYTHEDTATAHVAGGGDPVSGDRYLGAPQGPDSDLLTLRSEFYPWPQVVAALKISLERRGEGGDFRTHFQPADPHPPFPLGVVEKTLAFGGSVEWEVGGNSSIGIEASHARIQNRDHLPGEEEWRTSARILVAWDL
jgi:hypothetical protein